MPTTLLLSTPGFLDPPTALLVVGLLCCTTKYLQFFFTEVPLFAGGSRPSSLLSFRLWSFQKGGTTFKIILHKVQIF